MIVPVFVRAARGPACDVDHFGRVVAMRCRAGQRTGPAQACLRAADLPVSAPGSGVPVQVQRAVYQGGHFRVDARVAAAPEIPLHFAVAEPFAVPPDGTLHLDVTDGWVIPGTAA
jgi:hypothetical protein